jgi:predicted DNA-binding protein YlxM (UPF0122 family)
MKQIHKNIPKEGFKDKKNTKAQNELLRSRLDLLDDKDKFMMRLYLEDGYSIFQIARLTAVCEAKVGRRIQGLKERLMDGKYLDCLRNRSRFYKYQMDIAKDYFLTGLSIRQITKKRKRSVYYVRETIAHIKEILDNCKCISAK